MKHFVLLAAIAAVAAAIMPEAAQAVDVVTCGPGQTKCDVPEIDALAGLAAIGAVGAVVALIRERTKR